MAARRPLTKWAALALPLILGACAHAPTVEQTPKGRVLHAVRIAERAGAAREPLASFHLRLARRELDHAQQAEQEGNQELASRWLARAEADARLASSRAEESRTQRRRDQARLELERLRREEEAEQRSHQVFQLRGGQ